MKRRLRNRGQVLVMVAVALIAMFGIIGLAVDFGWMFYLKKHARSAADAAALAAIKRAFRTVSFSGPWICSTDTTCQPGNPCLVCQVSLPCPAPVGSNLENGCKYAVSHGFTDNEVRIAASTSSPFDTGTGLVAVHYWVTATVTRQVPQLFSAVLGNPTGLVSARATAAIMESVTDASFIITDRQYDPSFWGTKRAWGLNLLVEGAAGNSGPYAVEVDGKILLASGCNGVISGPGHCVDDQNNKPTYAGFISGGGDVHAQGGIEIFGTGREGVSGGGQWLPQPTYGAAPVVDPMAGRGQPPLPSPSAYSDVPVLCTKNGNECVISDSAKDPVCPGGMCNPGRYYAVDFTTGVANGMPITFQGNVTLQAASSTGFGEYVFYGGFNGKNGTMLTFDAGRYVLAGAKPVGNAPGLLIDTSTKFTLRDMTDKNGGTDEARFNKEAIDAGLAFILTDGKTYSESFTPPGSAASQAVLSALDYGKVNFQAGNAAGDNYINLHGLNTDNSNVPSNLATFFKQSESLLLWWDQHNSLVQYTVDGWPAGNQDLEEFVSNGSRTPGTYREKTPELNIGASQNMHLYGIIYQPRGAWTNLTGGSGYSGPLQIITGAFHVIGGARLNLGVPTNPATITINALIQ